MSIISGGSSGGGGGATVLYDFTLTGAQAAIDTGVDGVPAAFLTTGKVLTIDVMHQTSAASAASGVVCTFNNVTTATYDWQYAKGVALTVDSARTNADTGFTLGSHGSTGANNPAVHRIVIPGYAAATYQKMAHIIGGYTDTDANDQIQILSVGTRATTAITRFKISAGGNNLTIGSRVTVTMS